MQYNRKAVAGTYFFTIYFNYQRWLNHVKHAYIPVYVAIFSTIIYFIALYLFEVQWEMEIDGLAYSFVVYTVMLTFFSFVITHYLTPDLKDAFSFRWSEINREILEYLKLALPATIIVAIGLLTLEIFVLFSGTISAED